MDAADSPPATGGVTVLTTERGKGAIDRLLAFLGVDGASNVRETTYAQVFAQRAVQGGAVVFGDFTRMGPSEKALSRLLWNELSRHGEELRLLNDPHKQLSRFELQRTLWERGINRFNVFRVDEPLDCVRFPVFLRVENDHDGPRSDLLSGPRELENALCRLLLAGYRTNDLLVTEFLDIRGEDGLYRKYGAFRFGGPVYAQHMFASNHWCAKRGTQVTSEALDTEWNRYMDENPHRDALIEVFEIARVDYGRVDYGLINGALQIWEVNDNPSYLSNRPRNRPGAEERRKRIYSRLSEMGEGFALGRVAFELADENLRDAIRGREVSRASNP